MSNDKNMVNDLFLNEGDDAKRQAEAPTPTATKTNYVKLAAGQSIRVILLDPKFANYYGHGDFNLKIPSHVCTAPRANMTCKSCDAGIKRSIKYLVPLYDIDKKEVVLWDTTKKHVAAVYSIIDAYGDDVVNEVFMLKRTGSSAQDTSYSFIALPPKQKASITIPEEAKPFVLGSQERSDFYTNILRAPSDDYIAKIMAKVSDEEVAPVENQSDEIPF